MHSCDTLHHSTICPKLIYSYYSLSSTSSGPPKSLIQLAICSWAFSLECLCRRVTLASTGKVSESISMAGSVWGSPHDTSKENSLETGLFVLPYAVLMWAALTSPSFPTISLWITASFQFMLEVSSCTKTTSPAFTFCWVVPVVLWYSHQMLWVVQFLGWVCSWCLIQSTVQRQWLSQPCWVCCR